MEINLTTNLAKKDEVENLLLLIEQQKAFKELKKQQRIMKLQNEAIDLFEQLKGLSEELDNLYSILRATNVKYRTNMDCMNYGKDKIEYELSGNYKDLYFKLGTYSSVEYEVHKKEWSFSLDYHYTEIEEILVKKISLMKEFLEDYPQFVKRCSDSINYELRDLCK